MKKEKNNTVSVSYIIFFLLKTLKPPQSTNVPSAYVSIEKRVAEQHVVGETYR